jgi:MFS family permease
VALSRRLRLLERVPGLRLVAAAGLASGLGTWLAFVALCVDIYDATGSARWVSALLIVDLLPAIAIGLLLGPLLDRRSRRGVMVASDLVCAAVFVALVLTDGALTTVVLAGVAGLASGLFRPALYAGVPNLVDDADLPAANGLLQTIDSLCIAAAPLLGGLVVAAWSPDAAYLANAVSFAVSALLVSRLAADALQRPATQAASHWRSLADGFRLIASSRPLLAVLVAWGVVTIANAFVNVAEVVLAREAFGAGDAGFGLLVAAAGVGLAVGSFLASGRIERHGVESAYPAAIACMAIGIGIAAVAPELWVAALAVVLSGAGNGVAVVCNATLVQRGAPDAMRGRAFAVLMSVTSATLGAGMLAAGPLTDAAGPRWAWGVAAILALSGAGLALVLTRPAAAPVPKLGAAPGLRQTP